jgi:hypothetical protein
LTTTIVPKDMAWRERATALSITGRAMKFRRTTAPTVPMELKV